MKIEKLKSNQTSNEILFESCLIKNCSSFDTLLDVYQKFKKNNIGKTVILTLDDISQAEYTSSHAAMSHNIDDTDGYDLSEVDSVAFEDGEHLGYLSTPSEFFIRKENFIKQTKNIDFSSACKRGLKIDEEEMVTLEKINKTPLPYLDEYILLKLVPVRNSYEAICGFPNGYFTCDLNPFENYAVAKYLYETYNYELFGIGASLLGFIRDTPLGEKQAETLVLDVMKLYNSQDSIPNKMIDIVKSKNYFFIKYTESLEF
ncbi:hypothetical protein H0I23_07115 [Cellulophaga sp. HaHaR_3_176]|uniref:hypothetical protein n=1 Tax=Cellulophaga sp. HaHaR_3_176 TaxID=1942464 RepID=UPI001C1FB8E0|nr:hypothetical protein [Cellulophaga sp. HaHaR_3_176]QWX85404.1 hypothetical protein H0I23_07115 [Cellulophaga sp. HaHaR_3_176]